MHESREATFQADSRITEEKETTAFEKLVQYIDTIMPPTILAGVFLYENPDRAGTGIVMGSMVVEGSQQLLIPLGAIAPDGSLFTTLHQLGANEKAR